MHDGQNPRPLQLKATSRVSAQSPQAHRLLDQAAADLRAAFPKGHPVLARVESALPGRER